MQSSHSTTQVIIVGAGPTGLSLAAQLLRYKIDFILLEENDHTTPLSKAVVIQARTLEIFHEIGLAQKAVAQGRLTTAFNIFYKGRRKTTLNIKSLGAGLSPFPFTLSLEQSKTEKLLVDHLYENNKAILWGSKFLRCEQDADGVTVYYDNDKGLEQKIRGNYLVGCDGASSLVRHQLGLSFEGDTVPKIFYIADVTLSSPVVNKDELFIFLIKRGFILFFPMEGAGHYRVIGILPDKTADDIFTFGDIENSIKQQMQVPIVFDDIKWFSSYKVHSRKADLFMEGRCFIAGDAAHIHTPAGGQGMNTGIQDAYNLAWKIGLSINSNAHPSVLQSYNIERMENAEHLLHTTDRMFDFMTGSGWFLNFIRLEIFPFVARFISKNSWLNKRLFPLLSQTGIAYPNSKLTIKSNVGTIEAGQRMPYFIVAGGKGIFEYLAEPAFKILFFGKENNKNLEIFKTTSIPISALFFKEIPAKIFGHTSDFYILLRPDNHISYIGKDIEKCRLFLQHTGLIK